MKMGVVVPLLSFLLVSCVAIAHRSGAEPERHHAVAEEVTEEAVEKLAFSGPGPIRTIAGTADSFESEIVRSQEETNRLYGYVYDRGTRVRIESARISPKAASAGESVDVILTYLVLSHSDETVEVTETREVWFENVLLDSIQLRTERKGGTYRSRIPLYLPANMEKGKYKVVYIVQTRNSRDLREAAFTVNGEP